jgi:hypothetical protein
MCTQSLISLTEQEGADYLEVGVAEFLLEAKLGKVRGIVTSLAATIAMEPQPESAATIYKCYGVGECELTNVDRYLALSKVALDPIGYASARICGAR